MAEPFKMSASRRAPKTFEEQQAEYERRKSYGDSPEGDAMRRAESIAERDYYIANPYTGPKPSESTPAAKKAASEQAKTEQMKRNYEAKYGETVTGQKLPSSEDVAKAAGSQPYAVGTDISGGTMMSDGTVRPPMSMAPSSRPPVTNPLTTQQPQVSGAPTQKYPLPPGQPAVSNGATYNPETGRYESFATLPDEYNRIGATGEYQYDFFSLEGQKERLTNMKDVLGIAINPFTDKRIETQKLDDGVAKQALEWAANHPYEVAGLVTSVSTLYKAYGASATIGKAALAPGGVSTMASATPAAAGILEEGAAIGLGAAKNPTTMKAAWNFILKGLSTKVGYKDYTVGHAALVGGLYSIYGMESTSKERYNVGKLTGETVPKLREAGFDKEADELENNFNDISDTTSLLKGYVPLFGRMLNQDEINDAMADIDAGKLLLDKYNADKLQAVADKLQAVADKKQADTDFAAKTKVQIQLGYMPSQEDLERAISLDPTIQLTYQTALDKQAAEAAQPAVDAAKAEQDRLALEDERAYNEAQLADTRAYNEEQKAEQRAYNEQQALLQAQREAGLGATELETAQGSSLTFGLLNTSGAKEFVDKNKAAQYYFGKVYEELTPEQRMLLNLLKKQ